MDGAAPVIVSGEESNMRKYLLATTALLMFATPAVAKDHSGYVGLEGGFLWPKDPSGGKILVDYSATQVPCELRSRRCHLT